MAALLLSTVTGCATSGAGAAPPTHGASRPVRAFLQLDPPAPQQLDTYVPGAVQLDALTVGTLRTEARGTAGCAWLEGPNGHREYVLWPAGYRLRALDLALVDGDGGLVGLPGDRVGGGGGLSGVSVDLPRCGYRGEAWIMTPRA